jgi:hypothetical protein
VAVLEPIWLCGTPQVRTCDGCAADPNSKAATPQCAGSTEGLRNNTANTASRLIRQRYCELLPLFLLPFLALLASPFSNAETQCGPAGKKRPKKKETDKPQKTPKKSLQDEQSVRRNNGQETGFRRLDR